MDYLKGHREAFGFQVSCPPNLMAGVLRAATEGRPPSGPEECFTDKGVCVNSGPYDGMDFKTAKAAMDAWLAENGKGGSAVQYRLRDWNMGRQRFWGAPIPMVHCQACGWQPVPFDQLPVELPDVADYSDIRVSPLANDEDWQATTCPKCAGPARRDTDTMTTFMCSAWYFLRFCDPENNKAPFDRAKVEQWLPVDYYVGGKEHAVGHLLYSRFVTQALYDAGMLALSRADHAGELPDLVDEPFRRLFNQGIVYKDGAKMSKSKGNVVSADDLANEYGADTARLFSYFGGPADQDLEWTTSGVEGCHRFLKRIWRLAHTVSQGESVADICGDVCRAAVRARHRAVAGVTEDISNWRFNTAVAKLMEYLNELESLWQQAEGTDEGLSFNNAILTMAQLLSPFAPHIAEELWEKLGGMGLCCESDWPIHDPELLVESTVELPVQVNGKLRGRITVPADAAADLVFSAALADEKVAPWLEGKELVKRIYVPGRMVTLVVK
jgi:leucyl-tRNA synthetase